MKCAVRVRSLRASQTTDAHCFSHYLTGFRSVFVREIPRVSSHRGTITSRRGVPVTLRGDSPSSCYRSLLRHARFLGDFAGSWCLLHRNASSRPNSSGGRYPPLTACSFSLLLHGPPPRIAILSSCKIVSRKSNNAPLRSMGSWI